MNLVLNPIEYILCIVDSATGTLNALIIIMYIIFQYKLIEDEKVRLFDFSVSKSNTM